MKKESFLTLSLILISLILIIFSGCDKDPEVKIIIKEPSVEIISISDISETEATINARISNSGGSKIKERGVYLDGKKKIVAHPLNSETTFTLKVSNLEANTKYSVQAYAENSQKIGYSKSVEISTEKTSAILEIKEATEIGHHSAILNAEMKNVIDTEDYLISFEYSEDDSFSKSIEAKQSALGQNEISLSAKIEELKSINVYNYRLKAEDKSGEVLYSEARKFTTTGDNFSVSDVYFHNVVSDSEGNIYANGLFNNHEATVLKFSPEGNLIWRQNITSEGTKYVHGIAVYNNVVYVQIERGGVSDGGRWAILSLHAYNASSGEMLWETKEQDDGIGVQVAVSEDNFIYSVEDSQIKKLDLKGNIITKVQLKGSKGFSSMTFIDDKILASGGSFHSGEYHAMIWAMDKDLNILWSQSRANEGLISSSTGLVAFPENNLVFVSESRLPDVVSYGKSYILCYEYDGDGLNLKWSKYVDGSHSMKFVKEANNFYVYDAEYGLARLDITGPLLYSTAGDIVWKSSVPQGGNLAIFGNKLYMAYGENSLKIINK